MESQENTPGDEDTGHYWPDGLVPVTPQARRYGYVFDVYVTPRVWRDMCVWNEGAGTHTEKRLYELLESCYQGLAKSLAKADDFVSFTFQHFYKKKNKPKAKKRGRIKMGARLLLHPETEEPWLLLFDPEYDFKAMLKKGEPPNGGTTEDRDDEGSDGEAPLESGAGLDQSNPVNTRGPAVGSSVGAAERS